MYAINCHDSTNHTYGEGKPYIVHLRHVVECAEAFIRLIPEEWRNAVLAACWCHDVIEDTRQTYNDVKRATNAEVAELVYALTNEKGRNRAERGNDKYYTGIRRTPYASFVKLCDRIANVRYSILTNSPMFEMYKKENKEFIFAVVQLNNPYKELVDYLNSIIKAKLF